LSFFFRLCDASPACDPQSIELAPSVIKKILSPDFRFRHNIAVESRSDFHPFELGEDHVNAMFSSEMYHRGIVEAWSPVLMRLDGVGGAGPSTQHHPTGNQIL
jgi:hypothetical protein